MTTIIPKPPYNEADRCREEIRKRQELLLSGAIPEEMEGILQGLQDWGAELRIIEGEGTHL